MGVIMESSTFDRFAHAETTGRTGVQRLELIRTVFNVRDLF
jgi:hypothetical protein